jgi:MFS transporter, DHA1 family, chloramphenicol resistance protein
MAPNWKSRYWLVAQLSAGTFSSMTVWIMMGPLLVPLAAAFGTSVAGAGQLAAAIGVSWGITAPLVGPISDIYGRRRVALTGVILMAAGTLGSLLAGSYGILLGCRLLSGVGGAMIPPNSMATIADHFGPAERGRPISLLISASCLGYLVGLPAVAVLGNVGGWRLPFAVVGACLLALLAWHLYAFPRGGATLNPLGFSAHFRAVGRIPSLWFVLLANVLYRSASITIFTYLAAFLIQTYRMNQGATALPLLLVGLGPLLGSLLGGYVASRPQRLGWAAGGLFAGGLGLGCAFTGDLSPWLAAASASAGVLVMTVFEPVSWVVTAELAGESRATANGLLATSNQLGIICGGSVGGLVLALGGFQLVGLFGAASALAAAVVVTGVGFRTRASQAVRA